MPTERFQFEGAGGDRLSAALDLPDGAPRAYALFAHCFSCGKDTHAARRIAMALTAHGIAVLRFDFTGLGSSEGDFANTTFSSNIAEQRLLDKVRHLHKALLVMHSPVDDTVGIDNATHIFVAAKHPKSFISLDHADHLISSKTDAAHIAEVIASWAGRYVAPAAAE
ncbi:MAG: osmotically inducible protein C, partial [Bradyrhizobium sp.]|nr:osmotically inducible protein C [Bradyrhizobium sp.]